MPVIFGGALVSLLVLVGVFGLLVLHRTAGINLRAFLASFAEKSGFRRWFFRAIGLTALVGAIDHVVHRFRQAIATALAPTLPLLGRWLQALGSAAHWTYKEYGDWATHWADNFAWFRHRTLPHEINKKVVPVKIAAAHAGELAGRVGARERAHSKRFEHGIDRLRRETGLLAGILLGIDILVKRHHAKGHHYDHTHTLPHAAAGAEAAGREAARLGKVVTRHGALLKKLAALATIAGFTAVLRVALGRMWPWTRCSNFGRLSRLLKCSHFGFLADLLTLGLAFLAVVDPVDIAKAAILSEEAMDLIVRRIAALNPEPPA